MSLELEALTVTQGGHRLVSLDCWVGPGEILTLMAPSGAGKSTALAAIIGALSADFRLSGRIRLDGEDVTLRPTRTRRIGLLFQDDVLFPHLSVAGNLAFALPRHRTDRKERIAKSLSEAGLEGMGGRDPATLSGGQRARVALLRCLLAEPKALLLDEPFSRLDASLRDQIRRFTFDRARALGLPVILVTHDAQDARAAGGQVLTPMGQRVEIDP